MKNVARYTKISLLSRARARVRALPLLASLLLAGSACSEPEEGGEASYTEPVQLSSEAIHARPMPRLQAALDNLVAKGAPGAMALSRRGARVITKTSGVSNVATGEPIDARDRFRAASNTKPLVATVILQLVSERHLKLEDSVEQWLPGAIARGNEISVRQLLQHSSGIFHNVRSAALIAPYAAGNREHYWSPRELVAFGAAEELAFEPGHGFLYSNTNYQLLGLIIEAVTGSDALHEIRRRVLSPLGMRDSYLPAREAHIRGRHTHGYHYSPDFGEAFDVTVFSPSWTWTAGALVTTLEDLARFHGALFGGELLRRPEMRELLTTIPGEEGDYGLGVSRWDTPCGTGWGHEGDFPGYHSLAITSRDGTRQGVVAINSDDAIGVGLADPDLARVVFAAFCE